MKRILPITLLLLPLSLDAQEAIDGTGLALNEAVTLWANSTNAAGLAVSPYREFNVLSAQYSLQTGDYRRMQTGTRVGDLEFDTSGATQIGKVSVWGRFKYNNIDDRGASFNTLLYDPYDERFMYTAADAVPGQWKKQSYNMQFKAAMPLGETMAAGVHVNYTDRIAAGQIDPRAESYSYAVEARPGIVWRAGNSRFGLNGLYANTFERATPSISNTQEVQKVFLLKGLGNWVGEQVGSGGLSTMYFRCNTWGGALQYAYESDWSLLSELSYTTHSARITESATQPKPHGNTRRQELGLDVAALFGTHSHLNKLSLQVSDARTTGIEPTVLWNKESGEWEIQTQLEQCKFSTSDLTVSYDHYFKEADGYKWHLIGSLGTEIVHQSYATPYSELQYGLLCASAGAEYKFGIGKGSLLAGARLSGFKNLGDAHYEYNGHRTGTAPVDDLYPHNLSILSADRIGATLSAEYAFPVGKGLRLGFCGEGSGVVASCTDASSPASITLLHRLSLLAALRLYF